MEKGVFCLIKGLLGSHTVRRPKSHTVRRPKKTARSWEKNRLIKHPKLSYSGCVSNPQLGVGLLWGSAPDTHPQAEPHLHVLIAWNWSRSLESVLNPAGYWAHNEWMNEWMDKNQQGNHRSVLLKERSMKIGKDNQCFVFFLSTCQGPSIFIYVVAQWWTPQLWSQIKLPVRPHVCHRSSRKLMLDICTMEIPVIGLLWVLSNAHM